MIGLSAVANAYDAWMKQTYADLDEVYFHYNNEVARRHGAGSRQAKSFLVLTTTLYSLYTASQLVGQGFVDLLRIGQSVKDPSVGTIVQDGLRLVSAIAPAFRVVRLGSAIGVAGGNFLNSCGATAIAVAARLSGTKIILRLKDIQAALKLPVSPKSPAFDGLTMPEMAEALDAIGAKTIKWTLKSWQDVEALLDLKKGPVVFVVRMVVDGKPARHAMAAFRVAGETTIADQAGISSGRSLRKVFDKEGVEYISGWIVEDSALAHQVNLTSGAAAAVEIPMSIADRLRSEDVSWLAETLLIPAWIIPGQVLWGLGDLINEKLGRPRLGAGDGNGLSADATKVLRVTPGGAGKGVLMAQVGSGLGTDAFLAAVAELESKGHVRAVRAPGAPLGIASIVRIK